jgi:pyridoxamine 5'-phosphate oxidase
MPRRPDMPPLDRGDLDLDPIVQFRSWFELALREVELPEAMTLATVDAGGAPDARMVLLKGVDERGFRLFTNRESNKALQIAASPRAALVVYWRELDRQVRVRGPIGEVGEDETDAYFATRPRDSQLGAWASPQSRQLASRTELEQRLDEVETRFADRDVTRPPHWGGYVVEPEEVEFWQGRIGRLHDRFRYTRERSEWRIERLAP